MAYIQTLYAILDTMRDNSKLKDLVKSWERDLNKIIVNWDLIPGSSKDEFDSLAHKLIGHLTRGTDKEKIYNILESELIVRYGLSPTETELTQFTNEISDWWDYKK
jgi:hypothetical protein